jgi:Pentapeptide repeats (8 copies)
MQRSVTGWLGVLAVTGLLLLTAYVVVLPRLLYPPLSHSELQNVPTPKERIELQQAQGALQHNARTPLLQGLGSVLLAVGAIATWQQIKISREGQITDRFTHAIDQLGNDNPVVRVGGIRALERIAKNSPTDRATIAYVLGAFVRTQAPWSVGALKGPQHPTPTVDEQLPWLQHRAVDVQTAMWVLGSRPAAPEPVWLYLSRVDLRSAQLVDGRLADTQLQYANLAGARMRGVHMDRSDLRHADLRQADLQDGQLPGADLRGTYLQGANLQGANLQGARLEGADLSSAIEDASTIWPAGFDADRRRAAGVLTKPHKRQGVGRVADDA